MKQSYFNNRSGFRNVFNKYINKINKNMNTISTKENIEAILVKKTYFFYSWTPHDIVRQFHFHIDNKIISIDVDDLTFNYFNEGEIINITKDSSKYHDKIISVSYSLNYDFENLFDIFQGKIKGYTIYFEGKEVDISFMCKNNLGSNYTHYTFLSDNKEIFSIESRKIYNLFFNIDNVNKTVSLSLKPNALVKVKI